MEATNETAVKDEMETEGITTRSYVEFLFSQKKAPHVQDIAEAPKRDPFWAKTKLPQGAVGFRFFDIDFGIVRCGDNKKYGGVLSKLHNTSPSYGKNGEEIIAKE